VRCLKGQWEAVSIGPCWGDSNEAVSAKTGAVDLWLNGGLLVAFLGVGGDIHCPVLKHGPRSLILMQVGGSVKSDREMKVMCPRRKLQDSPVAFFAKHTEMEHMN
jgi:hypothetical protein